MKQAERKHLNDLAALGCILCDYLGTPGTPAEIHHLRSGVGMAQRSSHYRAIPLCPEHHRGKTGFHGLGMRAFQAKYEVGEEDLLALAMSKI